MKIRQPALPVISRFARRLSLAAWRASKLAWRVWATITAIVVGVLASIAAIAFFGFDRQTLKPTFPNELTFNHSSEGVERMRLTLPRIGQHLPFVGVALSGGGSRAANFSLFVLKELEEIGLLEHANAVSSVSGGSLTAAELALNLKGAPTARFWNDAEARLGQDINARVRARYFRPGNFFATLTSSLDRGDILAQTLDAELYHGATFADIRAIDSGGDTGRYRPSIFMNATVVSDPMFRRSGPQIDPRLPVGTYMSTFTYSFERFAEMNSSLGTVPIAYGVASSAAFPAAINPITLQLADIRTEGSITDFVAHRYVHLADGGLSDNLGTDTLRKVYETRMAYHRLTDTDGKERYAEPPCLIIAVDATSPPKYWPRAASMRPDGRTTWWSSFIDATAIYGYDAYLLRRRADQLDEMGIDSAAMEYGQWVKTRPTAVADAELRTRYVRFQEASGYRASNSVFTRTQTVQQPGTPITIDLRKYNCKVWHIALEDLDVRRSETATAYKPSDMQAAADNAARNKTLRSIADTALALDTDFKLKSTISPRCTPAQLQSVLKRAAQELVQDVPAKRVICEWMRNSGLDSSRCENSNREREPVPLACIDKAVDVQQDFLAREIFRTN